MNVRELIAALHKHPPEMDVCVWDEEADDYLPIVEALHEDGSTHIDLLTEPSGSLPVCPHSDCGLPGAVCGHPRTA